MIVFMFAWGKSGFMFCTDTKHSPTLWIWWNIYIYYRCRSWRWLYNGASKGGQKVSSDSKGEYFVQSHFAANTFAASSLTAWNSCCSWLMRSFLRSSHSFSQILIQNLGGLDFFNFSLHEEIKRRDSVRVKGKCWDDLGSQIIKLLK